MYLYFVFSIVICTLCMESNAKLSQNANKNSDQDSRIKELESRVNILTEHVEKLKQDHVHEITGLKNEVETMKNLVGMTNDMSSLKHANVLKNDIEKKLEEYRSEVMEFLKENMERNMDSVLTKYQTLQNLTNYFESKLKQFNRPKRNTVSTSLTQVAFHVGLNSGLSNLHAGQLLQFDKMDLIRGCSFTSGVFVANISGVYAFFATIVSGNSNQFRSSIVKNSNVIGYVHSPYIDYDFGPGSNMVIISLQKNDQVWIETIDGDTVDNWSTFSGFLLFPELHWQTVIG